MENGVNPYVLELDDTLNFIPHCTTINICGVCLRILGYLWVIEKPWIANIGIVMRRMKNVHGSEAVDYYCMPTIDHQSHYCRLTFSM
jgi:hypothetical protein